MTKGERKEEKSMQKLTGSQAHNLAVRWTASLWQDERAEVSFSVLLGQLPQEINGSPVYVVYVQGTVESCVAESYPIDRVVSVRLSENGLPIVRRARDQDVEQAEQYSRGQAGVEYGC